MAQRAISRFDEEHVESLSKSMGEPNWLKEYRLEALRSFYSLPLETSPLYKKYEGVSAFDPEQFSVSPADERVDLRTHFAGYLTGKETNIILQGNSSTVHVDLDQEFAKSGVEVLSMREALSKHEQLIRDLFSKRLADPAKERYAAFNAAFFNSGTFIHVPKGVSAPSPLRRMLVTRNPTSSVVEMTIIHAEEAARFSYLEELYTAESKGPFLVSSTLDVIAEVGAQVDTSGLQLLDDKAVYLSNAGVSVATNAKATLASILLGGAITRSRFELGLNGRGSSRGTRSSSATASSATTSTPTWSTTLPTRRGPSPRGASSRTRPSRYSREWSRSRRARRTHIPTSLTTRCSSTSVRAPTPSPA
jgi:Fe-S cluster assembly protein SufD